MRVRQGERKHRIWERVIERKTWQKERVIQIKVTAGDEREKEINKKMRKKEREREIERER